MVDNMSDMAYCQHNYLLRHYILEDFSKNQNRIDTQIQNAEQALAVLGAIRMPGSPTVNAQQSRIYPKNSLVF